MKGYWSGEIYRVTDSKYERPEIGLFLGDWITETADKPILPRAGEQYWLIDNETFRRLILKDDE